MTPIAALRQARPEHAAPRRGTDARAERELRALLGADYPEVPRRAPWSPRRLMLAVNIGVAAVLLAAGTALVITLGAAHPQPAEPTPPTATATASPTTSTTSPAVPRLFTKPADYFDNLKVRDLFGQRLKVGVASNGCLTVDGSYLIAPARSSLVGNEVHLTGIGQVAIGGVLQSASGQPVDWTGTATEHLHGTFACGTGRYFDLQSAYAETAGGASPSTITGSATYPRSGNTLPECRFADLAIWGSDDAGGAGQTLYQGIYVQNRGALCTLNRTPLTVTVDDASASLDVPKDQAGSTLPTGAAVRLLLSQGCGQGENGPRFPISLGLNGESRAVGQSFPFTPVVNCNPLRLTMQNYASGPQFDQPGENYAGPLKHLTISGLENHSYAGGPLDYTITIANHGTTAFDPKASPAFVEIATGTTSDFVQTGLLAAGSPIPPGGKRSFTIHSDAPDDAGSIEFYLAAGPGTSTDG